jgi:predicted restriction endonuclease
VFSPGDPVFTKTGKSFVIEKIEEERIRFRLLSSDRKMSLKRSRLALVIKDFEEIRNSGNLERAVREVLKKSGHSDSTNEPYLYGLAQEFLRRQSASGTTAVEEPMSQPLTLDKARKKALEEGAFDPRSEDDARGRALALIVRRRGQPAFRRKLLKAYKSRCAISRCDCPDALEAAHIRQYKGRHTNHIKNGILLRSDIHTLFDLGKIRILSNYKVDICDDLQSTVYKEFHDRLLVLPEEKKDWPDCSGLT